MKYKPEFSFTLSAEELSAEADAARTVGKLSLRKARRDLQACAAADKALVSSGLDARDILHKLIVTLTSA